ncbi:NACHT domain-containing protein [Streptomyces asoensis]|uniref:NACHT domain-containing protein n=1 Tax=Streptomyces asoensis TaxID=249586 RepID=UPI00340824E3
MSGGRRQSVKGSTIGSLIMIMNGESPRGTPEQWAEQLREDVRLRAGESMARLGLRSPAMIEISWKMSERRVQPSRDALGVDPEELDGTVATLADACRRLPNHQLVLLGEPGTGKSTAATHLVYDMTENPRPGDPVPVLMPLSSWRPAIPLREWLVRQIRQSSPGLAGQRKPGSDAATELLNKKLVMPVLDGLDELPDRLRHRAIRQIEAAVQKFGCWLLVTCRGDEYEQACRDGIHFSRAAAVELDTVGVDAAIAYLNTSKLSGDERWTPVFEAMRGEPESTRTSTTTSPLMLYLAQKTYRASLTDPGELVSPARSPQEIEDTLLGRYLPAVYTDDSSGPYTQTRARRYLELIARQMRRDGTVDFAWWQLNAVLTGPLVGLAFGTVWGFFMGVLFGPTLGVTTGLTAGLGGWFAHGLVRWDLRQVYVPEGAEQGPKGLTHRYAVLGGVTALLVATAVGVSAALWLSGTLGVQTGAAWCYGAILGAASGAAALLGSAWGTYVVSCLWFWITGRLPARLLPFLDNARELGVLRQIGTSHQFRHERLLRHLGGAVPDQPSRSAHGEWNDKWLRWHPLLPAFASVVQVGAVLGALALVSMMYGNGTRIDLSYDSGDRPRSHVDIPVCTSDTPCPGILVWSWDLPRNASRRTVWLPMALHGRSLRSWSGSIRTYGCPGGAFEATLAVTGEVPTVLTLEDSGDAPMPEMPQPIPPLRRPVSLVLHRLDDRPCSLVVEWTGPGLVDDGLEPARRRLGVDVSTTARP